MEVYMDDMLDKSKSARIHIDDLEEVFTTIWKYKMKLNPTNYAFGVTFGKFLSFMVSSWGTESNPEKIKAMREMTLPIMIKEVQHLIGRIATLSRFVSRSAEWYLHFFQVLK